MQRKTEAMRRLCIRVFLPENLCSHTIFTVTPAQLDCARHDLDGQIG
jgi:hypothetical protein